MCDGTNHDLIEIFRSGYDNEENYVVRWCTYCGSVCVDLDYDDRFMAIVEPMKFPQLLYDTVAAQCAKKGETK